MRSFLLFAAAVLLPSGESDAANVYYDWDLDDFLDNTLAPDCLDIVKADRPLFLADGSYPGPPIDVNEGDRVHVCAVLLYATLCSETYSYRCLQCSPAIRHSSRPFPFALSHTKRCGSTTCIQHIASRCTFMESIREELSTAMDLRL
jgi:hypothetical protein